MRTSLLLLMTIVFISSCHKKGNDPVYPTEPLVDKPAVKLKDWEARHLPSPFYHFEYNKDGFITVASFSSDLGTYDVEYEGLRIARMKSRNAFNKDILVYEYRNGQLSTINITNVNGVVYRRVVLTVNTYQQLQKLVWQVLQNGQYVAERSQQFSYHADGNLAALTENFYAVGPQTASTHTEKFEQYDNKVNPDAFGLLQPSQMMHLILLPAFTLQKNNPGRVTSTSNGSPFYEVDYSYTYDAANRPTVKTGQLVFTGGSQKDQHFETLDTFSYYD